jgi:hypothetical protein
MFPSPSILQHYVKFNIPTITMLEKLFGVGSFGSFTNHLTCHQTILLVFSNEFNLLSIVRTYAFTFLECWALISFALVIRF